MLYLREIFYIALKIAQLKYSFEVFISDIEKILAAPFLISQCGAAFACQKIKAIPVEPKTSLLYTRAVKYD